MIPVAEIRRAREVLEGTAIRTPLVRLDVDSDAEIWLKLEVLQPVRSFKIRGAGNAILQATDAELAAGVLTASAGNMAQGVAYAARLRGVPATIVVPDHAPQTKIDAIERYGGRVIKVPYEEWWQVLVTGRYEGAPGLFVHPVDNDRVMAGNGTIGLELLEQLDGFDTVVVPYGGGGLLTGIASAVKAERPDVQFVVAEPETGAPSLRRWRQARPTAVEYTPSFVDGSGSRELIPRVWEQASKLRRRGVRAAARRGRRGGAGDRGASARDRRGRGRPLGRDCALEPSRQVRRRSSASCRAATSTRPS